MTLPASTKPGQVTSGGRKPDGSPNAAVVRFRHWVGSQVGIEVWLSSCPNGIDRDVVSK